MAEEILFVEDIKLLSRYLKTREQLESELGGREPTREEWASSLNISTDELARQMMASALAQVCACMCWMCVAGQGRGGGRVRGTAKQTRQGRDDTKSLSHPARVFPL